MKRSLFILMAALLLVSLVAFVAACGDEETTETTAAPTETTAAPTDTTAAPTDTTAAPTETTAAQASGDVKVLRMAVPWPVGDPVTDNIQQNFIDKFNAAQTQYVIELHPAGSLLAHARRVRGRPDRRRGNSRLAHRRVRERRPRIHAGRAALLGEQHRGRRRVQRHDDAHLRQGLDREAQHEDRLQLHLPGPRRHQRRARARLWPTGTACSARPSPR